MLTLLSRVFFLCYFLKFLIKNKEFRDLSKYKRVGNGLSNTFIYDNKFVIKIKNPIREYLNKKIYNGAYENKFYYDTNNKFKKEFDILNILYKNNLAPKPIFYDSYYLILTYIEAINLSNFLRKDISIIKHVIEAIHKMHSLNIFHGDLNLDNILVTKDNQIKFIDFESNFRDDLSKEEKIKLEFTIFEEKMKRFYPEIWEKYKRWKS